ncbi:LysR family transcriptional regulator [Candidimonas nitroreducens]|uniref:LysR family transcriptional regulator n=1 Tax=Candidimonas nitroreducens TaxID=683354 RepID=A0A225M230_9BURK|nr:LysR family transcriptional regulator [Candidimonas nitroreducens]OWT54190.1 LysR family transcriptional regulator [Candidimonas nitroreducens]
MKNIMRPREMELFAAICRTGSVTQAAASTGLSQPGASAMLKELEARLNTPLFSRRWRRLELTVAGRALLPEVTHALAALDAVDKLAQSVGHRHGQRLILGTVSATGASLLPSALRELQLADPDLAVVVRVGTAADVIEMAIQQRIDLGVVLGSGAHEHLGFEKIAELGLVCVVRPDHAWARRASVSVDDLVATPYIGHSRHLPVGALTSQAVEAAGNIWKPAIEVMQFSVACALTHAGCGPAVLEAATGEYARRLGLVPIPLWTEQTLSLSLVWPLARGMSGGARFVKDALTQAAANLPNTLL